MMIIKLEVAEEMGRPAVKTGLLDQGVKEGRWESSSGEEDDVISNKGDSCGKRKEDLADNKGGHHLRTIRMRKILPRPLTFCARKPHCDRLPCLLMLVYVQV